MYFSFNYDYNVRQVPLINLSPSLSDPFSGKRFLNRPPIFFILKNLVIRPSYPDSDHEQEEQHQFFAL